MRQKGSRSSLSSLFRPDPTLASPRGIASSSGQGVFLVDIQGDSESGLEVFGILGLRAEFFLHPRSFIVFLVIPPQTARTSPSEPRLLFWVPLTLSQIVNSLEPGGLPPMNWPTAIVIVAAIIAVSDLLKTWIDVKCSELPDVLYFSELIEPDKQD
jgi:hypothetical protein